MTAKGQPDYLAYLLRLWRSASSPPSCHERQGPAWRASLECPQSGSRLGFGSIDDLFEYLGNQTGVEKAGDAKRRKE
jgi:hypothetical protein